MVLDIIMEMKKKNGRSVDSFYSLRRQDGRTAIFECG